MQISDKLKLAHHQRELQHIVWCVIIKQNNVPSEKQRARIAYLKQCIAEVKGRIQDVNE